MSTNFAFRPATATQPAIRLYVCGCAYSQPSGWEPCDAHVIRKGQPIPKPAITAKPTSGRYSIPAVDLAPWHTNRLTEAEALESLLSGTAIHFAGIGPTLPVVTKADWSGYFR